MDWNLCRKANKFSYKKYSILSSNRPRAKQLGIVKSMLHHAHNLCNEAEPIVNEVTLQNNALLHMCIILKMLTKLFLHINIRRKINKEAENQCNTICIPNVLGLLYLLWKKIQRKEYTSFFKKGRTLQQFLFNDEPKKLAKKSNVCHRLPCPNCLYCCTWETSQWWDE